MKGNGCPHISHPILCSTSWSHSFGYFLHCLFVQTIIQDSLLELPSKFGLKQNSGFEFEVRSHVKHLKNLKGNKHWIKSSRFLRANAGGECQALPYVAIGFEMNLEVHPLVEYLMKCQGSRFVCLLSSQYWLCHLKPQAIWDWVI